MSSKIIYERFLWFQNEIKNGKYPNTKTLAENFEITRKTACRLAAAGTSKKHRIYIRQQQTMCLHQYII